MFGRVGLGVHTFRFGVQGLGSRAQGLIFAALPTLRAQHRSYSLNSFEAGLQSLGFSV